MTRDPLLIATAMLCVVVSGVLIALGHPSIAPLIGLGSFALGRIGAPQAKDTK